jgi:tetratricopeptide (TPR) repeat protein
MKQVVFGPFRMDVFSARLLRDGVELNLRPQVFHALRALIQNTGRYVDYEQMIHDAWNGNVVSRHTVAVTVGEAKKALKEYGSWIHYRPKLGYRVEVPHSEDLIRKGWHFAQRYTRGGFEKALECFHRAAVDDSAEFRALEGMSISYLMLGAHGMRPPLEMYPQFLEAHRRAVELRGLTPELRADRAHALHIFERKFAEAETELLQAIREEPKLVAAYGHLILLYATSGRFDESLDLLSQAYSADALWPLLPAMEVLIRLCRREFDCAVACGKKAVDLHPYLHAGRFLYAQALEFRGQMDEALDQYRLAGTISPDLPWIRAHEAACLARSGRRTESLRVLEELQHLRESEYVDAYSMAVLRAALGTKEEAFEELERAVHENSALLFMQDVDRNMDPFREDPRFASLRKRLLGTSVQRVHRDQRRESAAPILAGKSAMF